MLFRAVIAVGGFAVLFGLAGCNYHQRKELSPQDGDLHILDRALDAKARAILSNRCSECHGNSGTDRGHFSSVNDTAQMIREGWIRIGNPESSPLYRTLRAGFMPPNDRLAQSELDTLREWITRALSFGDLEESAPVVFAPGTSELTRQVVTLFNSRCTACHNSKFGEKTGNGILDMRDPARMLRAGLVSPGHSEASPVFLTILLAQSGKAPFEALSVSEVDLVRRWIDSDVTAGVSPLVGNTAPDMEPNYASIRTHLLLTRCVVCHGGALGNAGNVSFSSYREVLKTVVRGDPARSALFDAVRSHRMPERYLPLTDTELGVLAAWILAGAPE